MLSLLYTSRSLLGEQETSEQLRSILNVAQWRNRRQDITGALVFTGTEFAQILEGEEADVASVMASILIDPRHEDVCIVRRETIARRSFPSWAMSLIDHDPAMTAHIAAIRSAPGEDALSEAVDGAIERMRLRYVPAETGSCGR